MGMLSERWKVGVPNEMITQPRSDANSLRPTSAARIGNNKANGPSGTVSVDQQNTVKKSDYFEFIEQAMPIATNRHAPYAHNPNRIAQNGHHGLAIPARKL
jgi:hypothetical protein